MRPEMLLKLVRVFAVWATASALPAAAATKSWQHSFVFDACQQRTFVETEYGRKTAFDRREHTVKAGTPVSLTIRYPRLFTSYRVLVEAQEVPEAVPLIRGMGPLPSIQMGTATTLPDTKGAREIDTITVPPVTVEEVVRAFLTPESARQLILQIQADRRQIIDGTRTVRADLRAAFEAVEPLLGATPAAHPFDRVPALRTAVENLRRKLDVPTENLCSLPAHEQNRTVASARKRRQIREWVAETDRLAVNYQRIGARWRDARVARLLDKVIRDVEDLDTRMNTFLDNLRAHEVALEFLAGLTEEDAAPGLLHTTLLDRWALDFGALLRERYNEIRTPEELRAITERFREELGADRGPYVLWLRDFAPKLWKVLQGGAALLGTTTLRDCLECADSPPKTSDTGLAAAVILREAGTRLDAIIEKAWSADCCPRDTPDLRGAVHTVTARVVEARSKIGRELAKLNEQVDKLFRDINSVLRNGRGPEIPLSLGVYNGNSVVTYRLFEQTGPEPYSVVPAPSPSPFVEISQGGPSEDETGATPTADVPTEGFRFLGEGTFEVHRTYPLSAFGAFTLTFPSGKAATSGAQMSYVFGAKVYFRERDMFPGAATGWRSGAIFGVPVNSMPGALFGASLERAGVELMAGVHWTKHQAPDQDMAPDENMTPDNDTRELGRNKRWLRKGDTWDFFIGVGFDSNIFLSLFDKVVGVGGSP